MASVEWIVANPPPKPAVFATIKADQWETTTETTHINVTLAVIEHSLLLLVCVAGYPITWHKANQTEPLLQTVTYNPALEEPRNFGSNARNYTIIDDYQIPAIDRYEATLRIQNFTKAALGTYSCHTEKVNSDHLKTIVTLKLRKRPPPSNYADILQGTFDYVRPQPAYFFRYWDTKLRIPFVYYVPPNATVYQALVTSDPDIEWTIQPPQWGRKSKVFHVQDFLELEPKMLSPVLGRTVVTVTRGSYFHKGDCYFVLRTTLENGTRVERRSDFFLWLDTIEYSVEDAEALTPMNASSLLTTGQIYELRLYASSPSLANARLQVFQQDQHTGGCVPTKVEAAQAENVCGIMGVSLFNESAPSVHETGVRVFIFVKKACILSVLLDGQDEVDEKTPSLHIAALETDVFGFDRTGASLVTEPPLETDSTAFTNESITFRCLMPKCHLFYIVWCGDWCQWPPFKYNNKGPGLVGQMADAEISFSNYSEHTVSADAYFPSLQKKHSGDYYCGLLAPSSRKQHIDHPSSVELNLVVKDPISPKFMDGIDHAIVKKSFKKGTTLPLLCKVTGLPQPRVTWTWKLDSSESYTNANDFQDNSTFEVGQPGIYVCNASSKYGLNNRTYVVTLEEEKSYLPFAIAIPITVVIFGMVGLLYRWMKRRAIQASFKELAYALRQSNESIPIDDSAFLNDQVQFLQYNRSLEIDRNRFTMTSKLLGLGEFGAIYKGELKLDDSDEIQEVAVKLPRDSLNLQQYRSLADELKIMSHIRPHVNVLTLVGACTQNVANRELFVLTEFCENGSLRDYLIKNSMKFEGFEVNSAGQFLGAPGAVEALLRYAYQAANGMAYLAAEKILHRDLALRNLLLTGNHIVKISDFGMSRQDITNSVYHKKFSADVPLPIFWMAVESLATGHYTKTSDVWSFGIVLWEMFSCGKRPYPNHEPDAAFRKWIIEKEDHRMGPPTIACEDVYQLMRSCWKQNPDTRPSFSECKRSISRILEERDPSVYQSIVVSLSDAWLTVTPGVRSTSKISDASNNDFLPEPMVNAYVAASRKSSDNAKGASADQQNTEETRIDKKHVPPVSVTIPHEEQRKKDAPDPYVTGLNAGPSPITVVPDIPYNICQFADTL